MPIRQRVYQALSRTLQLDAEQLRVLDMVGGNARAHVQGAAGTGKTVLARELCMRVAASGGMARFICFTDALARSVDRSFEAARRGGMDVRAHAIRRLAGKIAGVDPTDEQGWAGVTRQALERLPDSPRPVPALTVVDEAQDLIAEDWELVLQLAGDGRLWIFSDPDQRFWPDRRIPEALAGLPGLVLPSQHRLPAAIEQLAGAYSGGEPPQGAPDPEVIQVIEVDPARITGAADRQVAGLVRAGVGPQHVAVLTLAGRARSRLLGATSLGGQAAFAADDDRASSGLVLDTALRFKGLERPVVIIAELAHAGTRLHYDLRMHIALTRALAAVRILATPNALASDPRLRALRS